MSTPIHDGAALLRAWRKESGRSQKELSGEVAVSQPALCEWESGARRPELPAAVALEALSEGKVPIESWGYPADLINQMRAITTRRDAPEAA